ncbi:MAG: 1,4-alpha-glucan branching protein GlgB [Nitrospiraceae bacterium]|nr:1,4-alpha-glucan branching protein GlgB [Nitrospiraceae bacterium]
MKDSIETIQKDPFGVLGMRRTGEDGGSGLVVKAFLPEAAEAWIRDDRSGDEYAMERIHAEGLFSVSIAGRDAFPYTIRIATPEAGIREFKDPYAFAPVLTDFDLHLMGEGSHYRNYEKLGAHLMEIDRVSGVHFAVWAPNARIVSVIGDFNRWDNRRHPMRLLGSSGVWELFIPGLQEGEIYKFDIRSRYHRYHAVKSDPYGFFFELRPKSASIVCNIDRYPWGDETWMKRRAERNWFESPIAIYEAHLGSWMRAPEEGDRFLTYRELAERLIPYVKKMGYTHVELLPVSEHPLDASWGYQTIGYFAPTSRHGRPEDFMYFVDQCHDKGIGVLLDWSPAHFPRDGHGLGFFDGTCLYEHQDPRKGEHRDWGTLIFNYGRNEVRNFLISNALFWLDKYHIDGLRVDAVASMLYLDYSRRPGEWVPNKYGGNANLEAIDFIKKFNELTHRHFPGVLTIAEESTAWTGVTKPVYLGGLGFDLKWNMGWMNDTLDYMAKDPVHRKYHHNNLTFSLIYAFSEKFVLVLSHDEVVHGKRSMLGKMPGDEWREFANLRLYYGYMYGHPGKKLLFMGGEFGQRIEWRFDHSLDWRLLELERHARLQQFVQTLNAIYALEPSLHEDDFDPRGFSWIDFRDTEKSIISFVRRGRREGDHLVVICNFTPEPRHGYRIGVPEGSFYREILNSDSAEFGGSGVGNGEGAQAAARPWQGKPYSVELTIPPLAVLYLKPDRQQPAGL